MYTRCVTVRKMGKRFFTHITNRGCWEGKKDACVHTNTSRWLRKVTKYFPLLASRRQNLCPENFQRWSSAADLKIYSTTFSFARKTNPKVKRKLFLNFVKKIGNKSRLKCKVWNRQRCQTFQRKIPKWAGLAFAQEIMQLSGKFISLQQQTKPFKIRKGSIKSFSPTATAEKIVAENIDIRSAGTASKLHALSKSFDLNSFNETQLQFCRYKLDTETELPSTY